MLWTWSCEHFFHNRSKCLIHLCNTAEHIWLHTCILTTHLNKTTKIRSISELATLVRETPPFSWSYFAKRMFPCHLRPNFASIALFWGGLWINADTKMRQSLANLSSVPGKTEIRTLHAPFGKKALTSRCSSSSPAYSATDTLVTAPLVENRAAFSQELDPY